MSCVILGVSVPSASARLEGWGISTVKWDLKEKLPSTQCSIPEGVLEGTQSQ